jgi:hypothetical protein
MKVGDKIKDIEDGDCYFYGTVSKVKDGKVVEYILDGVIWNGEEEEKPEELNKSIEPKWWKIEKA